MNTYAFLHAAERAASRRLRLRGFPLLASSVDIAYRGENGVHIMLENNAELIKTRPLA